MPVDFRSFFRAIYRRLTVLCALYGELDGSDDEFARFDALAGGISAVKQDVAPMHWTRRSWAREREHPMHGLLGQVVFEGKELGAFMPVLRLAEKTHIGKATSHGLGRIRVEV